MWLFEGLALQQYSRRGHVYFFADDPTGYWLFFVALFLGTAIFLAGGILSIRVWYQNRTRNVLTIHVKGNSHRTDVCPL